MNMKKNTDQSKIRRKPRGISTSLFENGDTEGLLHDFKNRVDTRGKVENTMDLDDYLDFLHQIHDFAGHPRTTVIPMSGDRFLL
jgi:hypothetical protein